MTNEADIIQLERVSSGIPGLDTILQGGFFKGGVYIVSGAPGTGKTVLANQVCFGHAEHGGKSLYVTLLSESHVHMLRHVETLDFYQPSAIPHKIYYVSALRILEEEGLSGLMHLVRREIRRFGATLLVLDGIPTADDTGELSRFSRKFMHDFRIQIAETECVALLLDSEQHSEHNPGAYAMVDGLIKLSDSRHNEQARRGIEVLKSRGSASLRGRHFFRISSEGVVVYPRVELVHEWPSGLDEGSKKRLSVGVAELNKMLGGGLPEKTTTLLLGAAGAGKTTLGTHFLAQSSADEPGLHFGFYEGPERLVRNAATVGLDLAKLVERGDLEIIWRPTTGQLLDDLGAQLLEAVRKRGVKRLFVDGLGGYLEAADSPERAGRVLTVLVAELRVLGVTTLYAAETQNLVGPEVVVPVPGVSVVVDNMILLRFVEYRAQLHRLLSIIKVRGSAFDPKMREFRVTADGIALLDTFAQAESILSGYGIEKTIANAATLRVDERPARPLTSHE